MFKKIILSLILIPTLSACATIFNNEPKAVQVISTSDKEKYSLTRNGMVVQRDIVLPQTLMVPNGWADYALQNEKKDICPIEKTVNWATILNLPFGIIGFGIDAATGDIVRAKGQVYCNI